MESPLPAPTRVNPEHTVASPDQQIVAPDTHVIRASLFECQTKNAFSHVLFVALTASTAAAIASGPTTILRYALLPSDAAETQSAPRRSAKLLVQIQQSATRLASLLHCDSGQQTRQRSDTVGFLQQWHHGSQRAPPSTMESPLPAPTRVNPEHTVASPDQQIVAPDTHVTRASLFECQTKNAF